MRNDYLNIKRPRVQNYLLPGFSAGTESEIAEDCMKLTTASECYNFDFSDGTLREGYGLSGTSLSASNIASMWTFKKYDAETEKHREILMFCSGNGEVFYHSGEIRGLDEVQSVSSFTKLSGVKLNGVPRVVGYRLYGEDVILLCSPSDPMIVWDGKNAAYSVVSSPLITSLAVHFERLFVTEAGEKNAVWFSDDLDPTNWSAELNEGGFIELMDERGASNKVISFLNYIYIFRDYGISRLTAYADQTEFTLSNMFVSSGKIYADTVCLCGDRVIFLASDGLYAFDGLSTVKILNSLSGLLEPNEAASASYIGGKYYLAARLKEGKDGNAPLDGTSYTNNGLIVFDVSRRTYSISRGFDIQRICCAFDSPIAILRGGKLTKITKDGTLFGTPLKKKWSIPKTDFSTPDRLKHIKNIFILTKDTITLTLKTDMQSRTVKIFGKPTPQRVPIGISGIRIGADIVSETAAASISRPLLRVHY